MTYYQLCSNRTFMELKYIKKLLECTRIDSSNRTFMELKFRLTMYWKTSRLF